MGDLKSVLERGLRGFEPSDDAFERTLLRRDRKRRNQRIAAGIVGMAAFVAAVWAVTTGGSFNRTQQPAVQPTPTPPAGTALETAYLIDLDTGEMTQLPKSIAGCCYTVSPDGTMVAYGSLDDAGTTQVFIASLDGTDVQQVTHDQRGGAGGPFDWSPDGAAIAYTSGYEEDLTNIFVLDLATGETSQVTNEKPTSEKCLAFGPQGVAYPHFSPDGASIVYEVNRCGDLDVRTVPVTGGKSVLLVRGANLPTLSPDGSTLAVNCPRRFVGGICIGHADGTNLRVLVSGSAFAPMWSPDGTRIAYNNADNSKIFVVDVATGETTLVAEGHRILRNLGAEEWSPDGTRIAYTNNNTAEVNVVDVATGETTLVAEGAWFEWLDDHTLIIQDLGPP